MKTPRHLLLQYHKLTGIQFSLIVTVSKEHLVEDQRTSRFLSLSMSHLQLYQSKCQKEPRGQITTNREGAQQRQPSNGISCYPLKCQVLDASPNTLQGTTLLAKWKQTGSVSVLFTQPCWVVYLSNKGNQGIVDVEGMPSSSQRSIGNKSERK